ncbi:MAG TPA: protein kinase [Gemmatimonadaceae bacterium]|nr:protein kinase [Gemmatimonadaceae bacterium]
MNNLLERLEHGLSGRYVVDRQLGEGGMAVVYLARDLRHERAVAVKVLRPEISAEIGAERFLREIKMAAGLTHNHILPVFDSGEAEGLLYYVMPNMEGHSLRHRLDQERQLSLEDSLRITREVASALDYAHRHQVMHRDVKPENILLHEGAALVADFGIGKALSGDKSITQSGISVGTPAYMSPEQASGDTSIDGRSDLYSLGCVLYEMLTGEPPFTGPTAQAIIAKRFVSPVPSVRTTRDVPEAVDAAVNRVLSRTPVDRYRTGAEFANALRNILRTGNGATGSSPTETRAAAAPKAVAVLPFANMSADPENEYFTDGMTEEIINALSKVPGIHVASRSSSFAFKGRKDVDVRQVGDKLGVTSVLEGSVRKIGNRIRIAAQLVNVENGYQLWSETYDRQLEDVFAVQDEISRSIVEALKLKLGGEGEHLVAPAKNLDAYTTYLKGRFHFNKFSEVALKKALELFQSALLQDPSFARAYAGIADVWCDLADDWVPPDDAYPRAKSAAERALQRDPALADAMISIGKVLCWHEWKFAEGVQSLERAVVLAPNNSEAQWVLGTALPLIGRLPQGLDAVRRAVALDPLRVEYAGWLTRFLVYSKEYEAALSQGKDIFEIDDQYERGFVWMGSAYLALQQADTALEFFQRGQAMSRSVRSYDAMIVRALAALDRREEAEEILNRLEAESRQHYVRSEYLAMGHAALGNMDRAFESLERAYQARSAGLIYLHLDPGYEPLRGDPRYAEMVSRIGLR